MSEPENFIARWSRRKRESAEDEAEATKPAAASGVPDETAHTDDDRGEAGGVPPARSSASEPASEFDWTKLPPVETITAESDIRAFLRAGVPPELTRAALRRAWAADPKIRDFVGLADYDWDFNTPGAIAGFGPLEMSDEVRRQIVQMIGSGLTEGELDQAAPTPEDAPREPSPIETSIELASTTPATPTEETQSKGGMAPREPAENDSEAHNFRALLQCTQEDIAAQNNPELPDNSLASDRRPHGRALPK
ncbi:MAG TPA: DUF3306 domain-containing protein [Xanthobacteraceae bacterium]|nr:DUF3306 domain-containing protein [Xanthobacteraceae bacterium]